jgi:hypothetical protein
MSRRAGDRAAGCTLDGVRAPAIEAGPIGECAMFERFTNQARRVVVLAQEESRQLNHNYIGTEHLLLGLLHEGKGTGARALESMDITLEAARREVETRIGRGKQEPSGRIPFTPRAKKSLELSLRESLALGQNYIGTAHLLLALIRKGDGVGIEVLISLGADLNALRSRVIALLPGDTERASEPSRIARGTPVLATRQPGAIQALLDAIDARLCAIERHLGLARPVTGELRAAQSETEPEPGEGPATDEGTATGEDPGEGPATGQADELARLRAEVTRLTALLLEHGIDLGKPQDPPAAAG